MFTAMHSSAVQHRWVEHWLIAQDSSLQPPIGARAFLSPNVAEQSPGPAKHDWLGVLLLTPTT